MNQSNHIKQFIASIANKEYKAANDSLQKVVETKIKDRVKAALTRKK